jgi:signal transduction histidine kinase
VEVARRSDDPTERSRAAANVEAGIDGMSRLVSQLLTMSRLEDEEAPPTRGPVDWREVSRQVLSDCLLLSERRNVDMEVLWPRQASNRYLSTATRHCSARCFVIWWTTPSAIVRLARW